MIFEAPPLWGVASRESNFSQSVFFSLFTDSLLVESQVSGKIRTPYWWRVRQYSYIWISSDSDSITSSSHVVHHPNFVNANRWKIDRLQTHYWTIHGHMTSFMLMILPIFVKEGTSSANRQQIDRRLEVEEKEVKEETSELLLTESILTESIG